MKMSEKKKILDLLQNQGVLTARSMGGRIIFYKKVMSGKNSMSSFESNEAVGFVCEMNAFLRDLYRQVESDFLPRVFFSASWLPGMEVIFSAGSEAGIFLYASDGVNCGIADGEDARRALENLSDLFLLLNRFIDRPKQNAQQIFQTQKENLEHVNSPRRNGIF